MSRKSRGKLRKEDELAIQDNITYLQDELEPESVRFPLFQAGILDMDDMDEIEYCGTRKNMAVKLVDKLFHAGPFDAYEVFLNVLENKQPHICHQLKRSALERKANKRCPSPQNITRVTEEKTNNPYLDDIDRKFATIESLKQKLCRCEAEIGDLKKENEQVNIEIEELKRINVTLNSTIDDLKNVCTSLNAEITVIKTENSNLKFSNENLSQSLVNETKRRMEQEKLQNSLVQKCNTLENQSRYSISEGNGKGVSLPYSALTSILLFKSEIDETLVKILKTIHLNPTDTMWQNFFVFCAFWNWDLTIQYFLEMKMNPNILSTLTLFRKDDNTFMFNQYVEPKERKRKMSPLMAACANASYTTLQILLDAGADVNAKDELGDTALIYLCREDKTELQYYTRENLLRRNFEIVLKS